MRLLLLAMMLAAPAPALEDTGFPCKERLVLLGDSRAVVELKCGAPAFRDRRLESAPDGRLVTVDESFYDLGPQQFTRTLRFEDGKLVRIEVGDYGTAQAQTAQR